MKGKDTTGLIIPIKVIHMQPDAVDRENRTGQSTGNSVPYTLQLVCGFFDFLQFYEH